MSIFGEILPFSALLTLTHFLSHSIQPCRPLRIHELLWRHRGHCCGAPSYCRHLPPPRAQEDLREGPSQAARHRHRDGHPQDRQALQPGPAWGPGHRVPGQEYRANDERRGAAQDDRGGRGCGPGQAGDGLCADHWRHQISDQVSFTFYISTFLFLLALGWVWERCPTLPMLSRGWRWWHTYWVSSVWKYRERSRYWFIKYFLPVKISTSLH